MLQVKNLTKIYKQKNGADTHALDGVTLQFPEKGMVFLLGKSGSGKSTLLNVCGGLDSPTDGEIIVKGRSSKEFSQGDFDSYRNTFVGFIFQEYNILNEFSVEDNIALALELQGKPKDRAAIDALLEEVDLQGFAKRKPNTLSGGQKQRIAIARALVKSPEIIMADEPTGALDSNTGKQVFDTLKKLSEKKLVIVVSHDRDFAEQYGDRIIELKDGKVLSDVSKTQLQQKAISENVSSVGDVLCIKRGNELSDSDFEKIKTFLKRSENDVIIANNDDDVKNFKKVSRINDEGEKEVFADTDSSKQSARQYTKEESRFIRSRLPVKHAIKIGLSSLKTKPFRLVITSLLCTVAFILFGLLSTLSFYDSESTFRETLQDTAPEVMTVKKVYSAKETWYFNGEEENSFDVTYDANFSENDIDELRKEFGNDVFGGVSTWGTQFAVRSSVADYWVNNIFSFAYLPEGNSFREKINGSYPKTENEIVISSYTADVMYNCKVYSDEGKELELNSPTDIIGKKISLGGTAYTVVGILDSGAIPEKYDSLKDSQNGSGIMSFNFSSYLQDGLHTMAFVSFDRLKSLAEQNQPYVSDGDEYHTIASAPIQNDGSIPLPEHSNAVYSSASKLPSDTPFTAIVSGKTSPTVGEAVVPRELFCNFASEAVNQLINDKSENGKEVPQKLYDLSNTLWEIQAGGVYSHDGDKESFTEFSEEEIDAKLKKVVSELEKYNISLKIAFRLYSSYDGMVFGDTRELSIIGVVDVPRSDYVGDRIYLADSDVSKLWEEQKASTEHYWTLETDYVADANGLYGCAYLPYDASEAHNDTYWNMYKNEEFDENSTRLQLSGSLVDNLRMIDDMVKDLSQIFLYVGLVLAVFAALLLSNFISISISQKKREIGILRAVGARSLDVFKIFYSESFFIGFICVILSSICCYIGCGILNVYLAENIGASLLVFGPVSLAVVILIAFVTTVVATFLPVYNAAKKKPVDSIRSL